MADGDRVAGPPPKEAVDYLRRKGIRPGFSFRDVWREEHATSFTVAKMMDVDMLRDVQNSLTAAIESGTTREQWMRDMTEYLSKRGWWGRKVVEDPLTGKKVEAQLGSSRRLETIWAVNMVLDGERAIEQLAADLLRARGLGDLHFDDRTG